MEINLTGKYVTNEDGSFSISLEGKLDEPSPPPPLKFPLFLTRVDSERDMDIARNAGWQGGYSSWSWDDRWLDATVRPIHVPFIIWKRDQFEDPDDDLRFFPEIGWTAKGRRRFDWLGGHRPDVVTLEFESSAASLTTREDHVTWMQDVWEWFQEQMRSESTSCYAYRTGRWLPRFNRWSRLWYTNEGSNSTQVSQYYDGKRNALRNLAAVRAQADGVGVYLQGPHSENMARANWTNPRSRYVRPGYVDYLSTLILCERAKLDWATFFAFQTNGIQHHMSTSWRAMNDAIADWTSGEIRDSSIYHQAQLGVL